MSKTLGELIRERRLGRGLSLGQLASKVATSVARVRTWERGLESPSAQEQAALAAYLEIDESEIADLASRIEGPIEPPSEAEESPTEIVSASTGVSLTSVSPPAPAAEEDPSPNENSVDDSDDETESSDSDMEAAPEPDLDPTVEAPPVPAAGHTASTQAIPGDAAAPAAPRPVPLRYPESAPAGVAVEIAEPAPNPWNPLRYLYDPDKPWLYWVRAALTVIVLLVLVNILFDSIGELFDKIGEVFDSIEPIEPIDGEEL